MERAVAIKKLTRILGKQLGYRVDPKAPDKDDREEARTKLPEARAERDTLEKQMTERRNAILEADAEYQQLKAARVEAGKRLDKLGSITRHYRFTVGVIKSIAGMSIFEIKAEGDSWEEVIAKLTEKQAA